MFVSSWGNLQNNINNMYDTFGTAPVNSAGMNPLLFSFYNSSSVPTLNTGGFNWNLNSSSLDYSYGFDVDYVDLDMSFQSLSSGFKFNIQTPTITNPIESLSFGVPNFTSGALSNDAAAQFFNIPSLMQPPVFNVSSIGSSNYSFLNPQKSQQSTSNNASSTVKPKLGGNYSLSLSGSNKQELERIEKIFVENKAKYDKVAQATGVPAELICAIHYREGGCDFTTYLHNGQKLGKRTTVVPKGLLFHDWTEAAIHAIKSQSAYKNVKSSDLSSQLDFAERYNGLGYRKRGVASPYVWAGTTKYTGGMYVADGKYSASTKDKRVGVAAILDRLYS
ncbi:MAG: hypothetical protein E7Z87_02755 [Cyanobacteria bacterium SIG26]|nr:hypothetical protein [Cyanobacteria bacterium SIG26]